MKTKRAGSHQAWKMKSQKAPGEKGLYVTICYFNSSDPEFLSLQSEAMSESLEEPKDFFKEEEEEKETV